jgi:membrane fusion protein (multidrug efflux system)
MNSTSAIRQASQEHDPSDELTNAKPPHRARTWVFTILAILAIILVLVGIKASQIFAMINAGKHFVLPPESVTSAKVQKMEWPASRTAVATLVAVHNVTVSSELPGTVRQIAFESGAYVHKGELLVKLDTSTEEAQLEAAEAQAQLAKTNLGRATTLRQSGANSPSDLDTAESSAHETSANAGVLRATIAKKSIRAPFDGRIGIKQVELGQVLAAGATIATLQSVDPIYADFWLPQQSIADLKTDQPVRLHLDDVFPKEAWSGTVTTISPEVDANTRNVQVRATFANPDGKLRPGMFADVEIVSDATRQALVVPETAVIYAPYGDAVFTIEEKDKALTAHQKFVRLGERRGDLVAVASGLNDGETIVASGAFKLHNGSAVVVHNEGALGSSPISSSGGRSSRSSSTC